MTDVFDALVGQELAVAAMRQYVKAPVHAYLLSGPVGSSLHDTALTFAAALQCPLNGCGTCETCRLVLSEGDADVSFAERAGLSWRIDELREAERVSRRRPLGPGYQIVVIEDVELTTTGASPSAPALLKSLEETPTRTIFLLTAEDVPPALDDADAHDLLAHGRRRPAGPRHDRFTMRGIETEGLERRGDSRGSYSRGRDGLGGSRGGERGER